MKKKDATLIFHAELLVYKGPNEVRLIGELLSLLERKWATMLVRLQEEEKDLLVEGK